MSSSQSAPASRTQAAPLLILKEGSARTYGDEARRNNIMAARILAETLKTTLGPRGMDKMLISSIGDITITNDGATILKELDVQHPAAKLLTETSKAQDSEVGDGTTSVAVLAGFLLEKAEKLLEQDIHASIVVNGFKKCSELAEEYLKKSAVEVKDTDAERLHKIALTAIASKGASIAKDHLGWLAVEAVNTVKTVVDGSIKADISLVKILKKHGRSLEGTELVRGFVVDKEVAHPHMPRRVENARIALINQKLEIEKPEFSAEIRIKDPVRMKAFLDEETRILKELVDKIAEAGANVLFSDKAMDAVALHFLAKHGILAVKSLTSGDLEKLAKATGARIITRIEEISPQALGEAKVVEEVKVADAKMVYARECKNPHSVTVVLRGGAEHVVDEAERSFHDALCVVRNAVEDGKIVAGGGAVEMRLANYIRDVASKQTGKEQLAFEAYAEALEAIPATLAMNAGLDPIDILTELRAKHDERPDGWFGVDVFSGKIKDMLQADVIEPLRVKLKAVKAATEAACMILRIDDVISAKGFKEEKEEKGKKTEEKTPTEEL